MPRTLSLVRCICMYVNSFICRLLQEIIVCLTNATTGCTALMDMTEARLNSLNANNASAICRVNAFVGPTTSAPLAIYDIITVPTTTTTTDALVQVVIGGMLLRCNSNSCQL